MNKNQRSRQFAFIFMLFSVVSTAAYFTGTTASAACCTEAKVQKGSGILRPLTAYTYTGPAGSNFWTDTAKWSPSYPGTTLTAADTLLINDGGQELVSVAVTNNGAITNNNGTGTNGVFLLSPGSLAMTNGSSLTNNGLFSANDQLLDVPSGATINNNGTFYIAGMNLHSGGTFNNNVNGTLLYTSGLSQPMIGNLVNGAGKLDVEDKNICKITGTYNNGPGQFRVGYFFINGFGAPDAGELNVTGAVTLSGTYDFYLRPASQPPSVGEQYTVISAASVTGTFTNKAVMLGPGLFANVFYTATSVIIKIQATTAAGVSVSGRVLTSDGRGLRNAAVVLTDLHGVSRTATTGAFGNYQFDDVGSGESYVIGVVSKRYRFGSRVITVTDELSDVDFVGDE